MYTEKKTRLSKSVLVIVSAFVVAFFVMGFSKMTAHAETATGAQTYDSTTRSDLVAFLRTAMINRADTISFSYDTNGESGFNSSTFFHGVLDEAKAHDSANLVPRGGDFLKWSTGAIPSFPITISGSVYTYTFNPTYYTTKDQEELLETRVNEVLGSLNLSEKSNYEKVCLIYDYICDHVTYDHDHLNDDSYKLQFTAYAALINGTSVCQGYSALLYDMLLHEGIDCRMITGDTDGDNVSDHAWNIVKLDGKYYNVDVTFDSSRNQKEYFLLTNETFVATHIHTRDAEYSSDEFNDAYHMTTEDNPYELKGINIVGIGPYMNWGMIDMMVFVEDTAELQTMKPSMVFDMPSGEQTCTYDDSLAEPYSGKSCRVYICRVAAKEMTDSIKGRVQDGSKSTFPFTYSIRKYADSIMYWAEKGEDSYVKAEPYVKAMLNYGAYSQLYFDYNKGNLANDGIWDGTTDPVTTSNKTVYDLIVTSYTRPTEDIGLLYNASNLVCEASTTIRHYFTYDTTKSLDDIKNEYTFTIDGVACVPEIRGGMICIEKSGIGASDLNTAYDVVVTNKQTNEMISFSYSAIDYVKRALVYANSTTELKDLVKAIYYYNKAADEYGTLY